MDGFLENIFLLKKCRKTVIYTRTNFQFFTSLIFRFIFSPIFPSTYFIRLLFTTYKPNLKASHPINNFRWININNYKRKTDSGQFFYFFLIFLKQVLQQNQSHYFCKFLIQKVREFSGFQNLLKRIKKFSKKIRILNNHKKWK